MKNPGKAIIAFAVLSIMVLGAYFTNKVVAGGGKNIQYVPFPVQGPQAALTNYDLLLLNAGGTPGGDDDDG